MIEKDNGGSAFPTNESNYNASWSSPGLSLRDYFAAKAMSALIAALPHMDGATNDKGGRPTEKDVVRQAVIFADELLAELNK